MTKEKQSLRCRSLGCDQQLSDDHHKFMTLTASHRRVKLTAPEMISRSRDMVSAQQNLSGSRDLTTPISEVFCHPLANSTHYKDMKVVTKCRKWGGLGYLSDVASAHLTCQTAISC